MDPGHFFHVGPFRNFIQLENPLPLLTISITIIKRKETGCEFEFTVIEDDYKVRSSISPVAIWPIMITSFKKEQVIKKTKSNASIVGIPDLGVLKDQV